MLDKLKQLRELKKIQDEVGKETVEVEKKGIKVIVNGKMEVVEILLNGELLKEDQEKILKECINEALERMKIIMAQKMQQISGIGL